MFFSVWILLIHLMSRFLCIIEVSSLCWFLTVLKVFCWAAFTQKLPFELSHCFMRLSSALMNATVMCGDAIKHILLWGVFWKRTGRVLCMNTVLLFFLPLEGSNALKCSWGCWLEMKSLLSPRTCRINDCFGLTGMFWSPVCLCDSFLLSLFCFSSRFKWSLTVICSVTIITSSQSTVTF